MSRVVVVAAALVTSVTAGACRSPSRASGEMTGGAPAGARASGAASPGMPAGWDAPGPRSGAAPADYEVGVDRGARHAGAASAYIRSTAPEPRAFMSVVQGFRADAYRGRRVRLSGYVRAQDVAGRAGLWMQVIGPSGPAGFDNMNSRPIRGTSDWTRYAVVLDVPAEGAIVGFGFLLQGRGRAWVDDLRFDVVGPDVATTNTEPPSPGSGAAPDSATRARFAMLLPTQPAQPSNLGFEAGPR